MATGVTTQPEYSTMQEEAPAGMEHVAQEARVEKQEKNPNEEVLDVTECCSASSSSLSASFYNDTKDQQEDGQGEGGEEGEEGEEEKETAETPAEADGIAQLIADAALQMALEQKEEEDSPMLRTLKEGLDHFDLSYKLHPVDAPVSRDSRRVISFSLRTACGICEVITFVQESDSKFIFYMKAPGLIPAEEDRRTKAAVYLSYVNYGLTAGNFEMDPEDGEIRFKMGCVLLDSQLSVEMVKLSVSLTVQMMDRYFPGLMAVVYGGKDPKQAHDDCNEKNKETVQHAQ